MNAHLKLFLHAAITGAITAAAAALTQDHHVAITSGTVLIPAAAGAAGAGLALASENPYTKTIADLITSILASRSGGTNGNPQP